MPYVIQTKEVFLPYEAGDYEFVLESDMGWADIQQTENGFSLMWSTSMEEHILDRERDSREKYVYIVSYEDEQLFELAKKHPYLSFQNFERFRRPDGIVRVHYSAVQVAYLERRERQERERVIQEQRMAAEEERMRMRVHDANPQYMTLTAEIPNGTTVSGAMQQLMDRGVRGLWTAAEVRQAGNIVDINGNPVPVDEQVIQEFMENEHVPQQEVEMQVEPDFAPDVRDLVEFDDNDPFAED